MYDEVKTKKHFIQLILSFLHRARIIFVNQNGSSKRLMMLIPVNRPRIPPENGNIKLNVYTCRYN